ncbi:hypothetical protein [Methylobacterium indicum]|uniref:hypothetical protein n=1 Tax=Methylobacterium indicum TaxID=1775910 RepID=UPI002434CAD1|nr:hypothetical protein [Methylobacterium indicum]
MMRTLRRLGLQAALIVAIGSVALLARGGREAAALTLRPGLDPVPIAAPLARPVIPEPAPGVRVILPLPWTNGSAILASEALAARSEPEASGSR